MSTNQHIDLRHQIDPWFILTAAADRLFMAFYGEVRKNARRISRLMITLLPLMMLLVGSCKTSEMPGSYGGNANADQFRLALFPDRMLAGNNVYEPAAGYVSRAQKYVAGNPESLKLLTEQEISFLFGRPDMERRDANAAIWQYASDSCVVDFFFYDEPGREDESRVAYVDQRAKKPGAADDCLRNVISGRDI